MKADIEIVMRGKVPAIKISAWPNYAWLEGKRAVQLKPWKGKITPHVNEYLIGIAIEEMGLHMHCQICQINTTWRVTKNRLGETVAFCSVHDPGDGERGKEGVV